MSEELLFIREIRVAQFWRKVLGEYEYTTRDPEDLFRWYEAMELRGPDEIRAYLQERTGRHPEWPVTGIVGRAPHPPRDIVEMWLATHEKVRTGSYWAAAAAVSLACCVLLPQLNGCQNARSYNQPARWMPQPATLLAGPIEGAPAALSTLPSSGPAAAIGVASPTAASITARNGNSTPQSAPLGAETGVLGAVSSAAYNSVSASSLTSATSPSSSAGAPGAAASQGAPSAQSSSSQQQH